MLVSGSSAALSTAALDRPARPVDVWRSDDGLFYIDGLVNGQTVRFLIDTGASMIVLTAADARRAGAAAGAGVQRIAVDTANGNGSMAKVTLASVRVGGTEAAVVPAIVADQGLAVSLLGQSWLSHLASVTIEGDRMQLR